MSAYRALILSYVYTKHLFRAAPRKFLLHVITIIHHLSTDCITYLFTDFGSLFSPWWTDTDVQGCWYRVDWLSSASLTFSNFARGLARLGDSSVCLKLLAVATLQYV
jgi:hypothetical protein